MSLEHWLIYVSVVTLIVVTPGPAAALCLSHGVVHGRRRTLMTVLGLVSSSLVLIALSAFGLGAILATSGTLFAIVKYVGAAYLVWLGFSLWRAPVSQAVHAEANPASSPADRPSLGRLFVTGFLVGISNPKDLLFFGALFPQFIEPGSSATHQLLLLSSTWVVMAFAVMALYATLGSTFASRMQGLSARRALNKVTGCVFVAAGAALAWAKR